MSTYILIFGQILIDLIILILLIWLIKISGHRAKSGGSNDEIFPITESLLKEMSKIASDLDKNLEQKRSLSHDILTRLEDGLAQAEEYAKRIEKINEAYGHQLRAGASASNDRERTRSSIQALISKGFSKEEIARHLGVSMGEIELLIKLQPNTQS